MKQIMDWTQKLGEQKTLATPKLGPQNSAVLRPELGLHPHLDWSGGNRDLDGRQLCFNIQNTEI